MNILKLENKNIRVLLTLEPLEIISIKYLDKEIIYQQDSNWKKSWPILFPVCGKVNGYLIHNNKEYLMPRHGFFRDIKNWKIILQKKDYIKLEYISNDEFKEIYPFNFKLTKEIILNEKNVIVNIYIKNLENEIMYYSFGHHPGFIFNKNSLLEFEEPNYFTDKFENSLIVSLEKNIKIDKVDFNNISFENSKSYLTDQFNNTNIKLNNGNVSFTIQGKDYHDFTIWRESNDCNFICVEHWNGIPDLINKSSNEFKNKNGNVALNPFEEKKYSLKILF